MRWVSIRAFFTREVSCEEGEPMTTILPAPDTSELEKLSALTPELALREAASIVISLVRDPSFLDAQVLSLL